MRKLFSLFCAIAIALCASAAPVAQKAQVANLNQLSATPELKVINQEAKAKIGPKDMAAQSRSVAPRKAYSSTLAYKCGPTEVVVTDLSTPTYNEFKLTITQKAKNTSEYNKETLYDNTVELILDPDEHSIVGTFTTDDYTIGASSFLKSGSNTRYVSYWENSTITIVSKGGNKYAITDGLLQVESSNGKTLYKYNYCYAAADLNNQDAEKTAFEFTFGEEPTPPQTWGEWEDFAPLGLNTGKYTFSAMFNSPQTQANIPVQVRKDNTGFKQFKFIGWGKGLFTNTGIDLIVDMGPDNVCTVAKQDLGLDPGYGENIQVQDYASKTGQDVPSTYDPETGTFDLALSYFISLGTFGSKQYKYETMVMDKLITERDTVKVNLNAFTIVEDVNSQTGAHRGWLFQGQDTDTLYIIQVLGQGNAGTFSYADGTLGKNFYNVVPSNGQGRCQFTEGTVTTAQNQDGIITLVGEFVGQDEKAYVFHWSMKLGVLQYDADAPFDATFAYEDMESFISNGVISISATNAEGLTIGLELYADPTATTIPEGVYTISDSQEAGTALKSVGMTGGFLNECFAGIRAASGAFADTWFMVEGTVTLSYDEYGKLKVVVDAKNSYEQPVTVLVQYSSTPTALPTLPYEGKVGKEAAKFLHNGQLIIRKGNKHFNALGAEVK